MAAFALSLYTSYRSGITTIFVIILLCILIYREKVVDVIKLVYSYEKFFMFLAFLIFICLGMKMRIPGRGFWGGKIQLWLRGS